MQNNKYVVRFSMTARLAFNDFKSKYAGSFFGTLWAAAEPFITVLVYWFVYTIAVGSGEIHGIPYYLWLSAGIAPWFFISNGLRGVTAVFRDYSFLVKKMRFDKGLLPSVRAVSALISHLIFLALVFVLCVINGLSKIGIIYASIGILTAYIFVSTLGGILALACARFKDISNILNVILNIGFWLTPIFWDSDNLSGSPIIRFNPAAAIVREYRAALLYGSLPDPRDIIYSAVFCLVLIIIGRLCMRRFLPDTADRL